jgi:hypothetical protein
VSAPNSETRRLLFEVGRFVATRRGPDAREALRAISDVMVAFERISFEAEEAKRNVAGLQALLDRAIATSEQAVDFARRHRTAANYYSSACRNLEEAYLDLAGHAGVVVQERPPC